MANIAQCVAQYDTSFMLWGGVTCPLLPEASSQALQHSININTNTDGTQQAHLSSSGYSCLLTSGSDTNFEAG